jgi:lactoylglutathione lyase
VGGRFFDAFPILEVSDVGRSVRFYRDQLGYEVTYTFPADGEPEFVSLDVAGGKLGLGAAAGPVHAGSTAIWGYTDDVDATFVRLVEAGAEVVAEPADMPWGERAASVLDPDGYTIHLGSPTA